MTEFTFTSTTECNLCGAYLSSSDDECNHNGQSIDIHVFRRMSEGRDSMVGVECAISYKWYALEEKVGDDWIAYQWLGTRESVESMLNGTVWDDVSDLPKRAMSLNAPPDVGESED